MSLDPEYLSRSSVVADGKVYVLIDEFITKADGRLTPERDDGPCTYTIQVKKDSMVVHEFEVMADEIELVRL